MSSPHRLLLLAVATLAVGCNNDVTVGHGPGVAAPEPPPAKAAADAVGAVADAVRTPPTPLSGAPDPHADLYGDQGGEPVLTADTTEPGALMRARKGDSFYKITSVQRAKSQFGWPALNITYEQTRAGEHNGITVVTRQAEGRTHTYLMFGPMERNGTITLEQRGPGSPFDGPEFTDNMEVYFTRGDARYGAHAPTFKVSNSYVLGKMTNTTRARNWTAEEAKRLSAPPPAYAAAGAHPDVGEDTPFAGSDQGGSFRFVDPEGALIGVEWWPGSWDNENCLARVNPVFTRDQPPNAAAKRVVAREGYAVGGLNVRGKRFVNAVQLIFYKLRPDGSLDPADSYTSDWLAPESYPDDLPETTLGADGRKVIGLHQKAGGVLDGIALVLKSSG